MTEKRRFLRIMTTGEVARYAGVATRTAGKWIDSGRLKGYRIPGSHDRRVWLTDFVEFLRANSIPVHPNLLLDAVLLYGLQPGESIDGATVAPNAFELGVRASQCVPHAVVIGDADGFAAAAAVAARVREMSRAALIVLVVSPEHAGAIEGASKAPWDKAFVRPVAWEAVAAAVAGVTR